GSTTGVFCKCAAIIWSTPLPARRPHPRNVIYHRVDILRPQISTTTKLLCESFQTGLMLRQDGCGAHFRRFQASSYGHQELRIARRTLEGPVPKKNRSKGSEPVVGLQGL